MHPLLKFIASSVGGGFWVFNLHWMTWALSGDVPIWGYVLIFLIGISVTELRIDAKYK